MQYLSSITAEADDTYHSAVQPVLLLSLNFNTPLPSDISYIVIYTNYNASNVIINSGSTTLYTNAGATKRSAVFDSVSIYTDTTQQYIMSNVDHSSYTVTQTGDPTDTGSTTYQGPLTAINGAHFTYTDNGGGSITFTPTGITPPGFTADRWNWAFTDGQSSTSFSPTHTYLGNGTYSPQLGVSQTTPSAQLGICSLPVTISGQPFVSTYTYTQNNNTISFTITNYNTTGTVQYSFDTGDGHILTNPSTWCYYRYYIPGSYTPIITVTDDTGSVIATTTSTVPIVISNTDAPIDVNSNWSHPNVSPEYRMIFSPPDVYYTSGTITYDWDFGDGSPHSTDRNPVHEYTLPFLASYDVVLTISDDTGRTATTTLFFLYNALTFLHVTCDLAPDTVFTLGDTFTAKFTASKSLRDPYWDKYSTSYYTYTPGFDKSPELTDFTITTTVVDNVPQSTVTGTCTVCGDFYVYVHYMYEYWGA